MVLQITERGGVAFAAGKEMLVNAEHDRTSWRVPLGKLAFESVLEVALDRRRSDPLSPAQPAAVDTVQVLFIDGLLEGFTGPLAWQDARQSVAVLSPAALA